MPVFAPSPVAANHSGIVNGMRTTIDNAGRIVIPKSVRDALRLLGGDKVELTLEEDRIVLAPAPRKATVRRGPHGILCAELENLPKHGPEEVREELERLRR
jgi:AbrB family looped-hinge helix DNA binding protein